MGVVKNESNGASSEATRRMSMKIGDSFKFNGEVGSINWIGKSYDRKGYLMVGVDFDLDVNDPSYGMYNFKSTTFYVRGCIKTLAVEGWGYGRK